jgi:hypothetical protein
MINSSPIPSPPPELVQEWINEENGIFAEHIATRAAQWGADQELEACCKQVAEWQEHWECKDERLRAARRPKPLTLKERALETFDKLEHLFDGYGHDGETIREALEALPSD